MSKLNAGISEAMYAIKQWRGVNENPDGDTNLRDGEAAVMRNFRITDGGALRKRPGSAIVAGLLASYSVSVGGEKLVKTEKNSSSFGTPTFGNVNVNEKGEIIFSIPNDENMKFSNASQYVGAYYASSDPTKAWKHSRSVYVKASGEKRTTGGSYSLGSEKRIFAWGEGYSGHPADVPTYAPYLGHTFYRGIKIENGKAVPVDGKKYRGGDDPEIGLYDKHEDGNIYILTDIGDIVNSAGEVVGNTYDGRPITNVVDDRYEWYANEVSNVPNTSDTVVRGIWSGYVGDTEYIVAACNGHLWSLAEDGGEWSKTDIGIIDTTDHVCLFGFDGKLYCMDGKEYYVWDGVNFRTVEGYIPLVATGSSPAGAATTLERVNLLTPKRRQIFSADGTATVYQLVENNLASVDKVYINGAEVSGHTVNAAKGTVTFSTAPGAGVDNVEIYYTAKVSYRSKVAAMRYAEFYNGANDSRVFIYGDGSHITRYSDIRYDTGMASAEYFPDLNEIAIGDSNTPITALIRQYSRLMAFKHGGSAWSIYYDTLTLADGTVTAGFYCNGVNRSIGNDALGQACLVENKPRTVDGRSIYEWQSASGGYITNDQRNAKRISQKVEATLLGFDLANCTMFFDKINHEFYCIHKGKAVVENTENGAWYIYENFPAVALIIHKDELYFGTEVGDLRRFSDDYTADSGAEIGCYWESGSMSFGRDYVEKYSPSVWVGLKQEDNAAVTVGIETDRNELITEDIVLPAGSDAMPRMNRRRLKAQKFTYYKLIFKSISADTRATVVAADIKVKYNINVK